MLFYTEPRYKLEKNYVYTSLYSLFTISLLIEFYRNTNIIKWQAFNVVRKNRNRAVRCTAMNSCSELFVEALARASH